jgi:hypothetical protein
VKSAPDKKTIDKYLKAVRIAAESPEPAEAETAKGIVKNLIDKHPDLPFHAVAQTAEAAVQDRMKDVQAAAQAAGAKVAPGEYQGLLDGLLARTTDILGTKLAQTMDAAVANLMEGAEGFMDEPTLQEQMLPENPYERIPMEQALEELGDELDPEDNAIAIEELEDGSEIVRIEISIPIDLADAILGGSEEAHSTFVHWLFGPIAEEDTEEEE